MMFKSHREHKCRRRCEYHVCLQLQVESITVIYSFSDYVYSLVLFVMLVWSISRSLDSSF